MGKPGGELGMGGRHDFVAAGRKLIHLMRRSAANRDAKSKTITRRIALSLVDGRPPSIYTVDFSPTLSGMVLVSCRELPEIMFCSRDQADGLIWAELAIEEAIASPRCSSEFQC
jgi:hypothetical protein